jgi:hypothetical protein
VHAFPAELWRHEGEAGWWFVTVPPAVGDDVRARSGAASRPGFGSVRVRVTVGATTWTTSVFPDSRRGAYLLPVKKAVRAREHLDDGDEVVVHLEVLDR